MTEKGYFQLDDNKTSVKILQEGLYRVNCQIYSYNSNNSGYVEVMVRIDGENVTCMLMQSTSGGNYATLQSNVIHKLNINQKITFYVSHGTIGGNEIHNIVHIEKV